MLKINDKEFIEGERKYFVFAVNRRGGSQNSWFIKCEFETQILDDEEVKPLINFGHLRTERKNLLGMVGETFDRDNMEECDALEDYLYFYDQEPLDNYEMEVLEVKDNMVHIHCEGDAVIDSDEEPIVKASFVWDCWLPGLER